MLYCVVAREAPRKVGQSLARHFSDDPTVTVVVERRGAERRAGSDRRHGGASRNGRIAERRRVKHGDGLRVADRRAVMGPSFRQVSVPRAARNHETQILFGSHVERSVEVTDDVVAARAALAHQAGDTRAFEALYTDWFDRTYTFFSTVHYHADDIEGAVNSTFSSAFERLGSFAPATMPFRVWLGEIAASIALEREPDQELESAETRLLDRWVGPPDLEALAWLRDEDLVLLLRQLPSPQRELTGLHYVYGLSHRASGEALGMDVEEVRELHDRALRFMSGCLTSLSRRPGFSGRLPMLARRRYYPVTTGRKRALVA